MTNFEFSIFFYSINITILFIVNPNDSDWDCEQKVMIDMDIFCYNIRCRGVQFEDYSPSNFDNFWHIWTVGNGKKGVICQITCDYNSQSVIMRTVCNENVQEGEYSCFLIFIYFTFLYEMVMVGPLL